MPLDFTVAITTYNGMERVGQVLDLLQTQTQVENISWEIIVVDNNSSDRTSEVIQQYQQNWQGNAILRYSFEKQQGQSFARNHAIAEANSKLIGFLDDDNLPASNWVAAAYKFAQEHPQAGAFGSQIHGLFETEPTAELKEIVFYLAITERGSEPLRYDPKTKGVPPGAGIVVRRDVWLESVPKRLVFTGRKGKSLVAAEDAEALMHMYNQGWEIWYNPAMELQHVIPSWRLDRDYLRKLMRGIGLSRYYLRMLQLNPWKRPLALIFYLISDTRKLIIYWLHHHRQIKENIVTACEIERLFGSLISPFYTWKIRINNYLNIDG
jgi:glycosyltransferase involved in cell wall biosynthesis